MSVKKLIVKSGAYHDSVTLLLQSKEMNELEGVIRAMVAMATPTNREILAELGWTGQDVQGATENDLVVAVEAEDGDALDRALGWLETRRTSQPTSSGAAYHPRTLRRALADAPASNLVQISVPGRYAYREARSALLNDKHVMLFSDNVSIEEEVALKDLAAERGLLLMGPDCGTAILNGVCLGFANVVPRGPVGIVAASGTGAQEVSSLLGRKGIGISQLIGTGGRDLSAEVGGRMMRLSLRALDADPNTQIIVLVSKPPAEEVGKAILSDAGSCSKPVVVNFLGENAGKISKGNVKGAGTLEEAAGLAVEIVTGEVPSIGKADSKDDLTALASAERAKMAAGQRYLRGLFTGGTLADEAMILLKDTLTSLYSNGPVPGCSHLEDRKQSREHTILDLGADEFTVGRAHPMIDPMVRNLRIVQEAQDPETAVLLLDVVLGYGSNTDPAGEAARAVEKAAVLAQRDGRYISVVASICGTDGDPQNMEEQQQILKDAGVHVFASNAQASRFCGLLLAG